MDEIERLATKEGYDRWASIYDAEDNPLIALEDRFLPGLLGDVCGQKVLDVGCGTGRVAMRMADAGALVTAVDFSEGMLAVARSKPGADRIRFVQQDVASRLPFSDQTFDRVVCCLVLEHIETLDAFFLDLARVCRRDGKVIASAMHPAMMLKGIQARFRDPQTGREVRPRSLPNQISDFVMAATRAGLLFEALTEHAVDEELASLSPRSVKYLGWPLLLLMALKPSR